MEHPNNERKWALATTLAGILFWLLVVLQQFVLSSVPEFLKWGVIAIGLCYLALQGRNLWRLFQKKKE